MSPIAFLRLRFAGDAAHGSAADAVTRIARLGISHLIVSPAETGLALWKDAAFPSFLGAAQKSGLQVCLDLPAGLADLPAELRGLLADGSIAGLRIADADALVDPVGTARRLAGLLAPLHSLLIIAGTLGDRPDIRAFPGVICDPEDGGGVLDQALLDFAGLAALDRISGQAGSETFRTLLERARRDLLRDAMEGAFGDVIDSMRQAIGDGVPRDLLRSALEALILGAPELTIHLDPDHTSAAERVSVERLIALGRSASPELGAAIFDRLQVILSGDEPAAVPAALKAFRFARMIRRRAQDQAARAQYRLPELEGTSGEPPASLTRGRFHELMRRRQRDHGPNLLTGVDMSGQQARCRLTGLADLAVEWTRTVADCERHARLLASYAGGLATPSPAERLVFYRILVALWPADGIDAAFTATASAAYIRALQGAQPAAHDASHEAACARFAEQFLASAAIIGPFEAFARRAGLVGALVGLARLVLGATAPGMPALEEAELAEAGMLPDWAALAADWPSGRLHAALAARLLQLRREMPQFFSGGYEAVTVRGTAGRPVAFARQSGAERLVVVTPTRFAGPTGGGAHWPSPLDCSIVMSGKAENLLTGGSSERGGAEKLAMLAGPLPFAILRVS